MANIAGFPGYNSWNDQRAAENDFRATGGVGKGPDGGGSSGGGGGGQDNRSSAADIAKLSSQAAGIIHPYYVELARLSQGNFDQAVKLMKNDYTAGVKVAKENFAYEQKYGTQNLNGALSALGVDFNKENEATVDKLNERGMAVYQNNPDGTPNVVTPGSFNPSYDANTYTSNQGVSAMNPNMSKLGRGGVEAENLRRDQQLRAEATMRAGMKPLEASGIQFKQTTNATGFNPDKPMAYSGDPANLGFAERKLQETFAPKFQEFTNTSIQQRAQERSDIANTASLYANTKDKSIGAEAEAQLRKDYNTDFIKSGLV